jgi:glutaredoxin-related protein
VFSYRYKAGLIVLVLLVAGCLPFVLSAQNAPPLTGQWLFESTGNNAWFTFRYDSRHEGMDGYGFSSNSQTVPFSAIGLTDAVVNSAGQQLKFDLTRAAGTFKCEGWVHNGSGSGHWIFAPNTAFPGELAKRGVQGTPTDEQMLRLAMSNLSLDLVDEFKRDGYAMSVDNLVRAANHGVTVEYVHRMKEAGVKSGSLEKLIRLRDHGVTPEYVRGMTAIGFKDLGEDELVKLRDHGVTPEFATEMKKAGFGDLSAYDLTRLRDHGVGTDFVSAMRNAGFTNLTWDEFVKLRDHGVDSDFVAGMKRVGIANVSAQEYVRMRDHGVTADFAAAVKKIEPNITVSDLVRMKDHGVSASYLESHRNGRSVDEVIRLHDRGGEDEAKF